jgi:shikimate dehydrogenase
VSAAKLTGARGAYRCAVLGSPIRHSLSPALHRAAYATLGLTGWSYDAYEIGQAGLTDFVRTRDATWRGLSLTRPLKAAVLGLGEADRTATLAGAGNTLLFDREARTVHNTDVGGLIGALGRVGVTRLDRMTVLGAGGTARAALVAAARMGVREVAVVARDPEQARGLEPVAYALGVVLRRCPWGETPAADVLVSTVAAAALTDRAGEIAAAAPVVFDVLYDPWPTPLAAAAEAAGRTTVSGLDLLAEQARLQIELMTGAAVPTELLLSAGRASLSGRDPRVRD